MVIRTYDVLVIGQGGREHALCWKLAQSQLVDKIYCAPGNGGTAQSLKTQNVTIDATDIQALLKFAKDQQIYLTVVGPEAPLAEGIVDAFEREGLKIFGPNKAAARLETSKAYAKSLMKELNLPTARFEVFSSKPDAVAFCHANDWARVIKVDGLAAGKGVYVCDSAEECEQALIEIFDSQRFGQAGETVVVEERLNGPEVSLMVLSDGKFLLPMAPSQDYKRRYEGGQGPNTGGMGAYSPVPFYKDVKATVQEQVIDRLQTAMDEKQFQFKGCLFIGLMIQDGQPYVLEFNVRFGDPETQCLLPRLENDLFMVLEACTLSCLSSYALFWHAKVAVGAVICAESYPQSSSKNVPIAINALPRQVELFHAGTELAKDESLRTNGGRLFNVVAIDETFEAARQQVAEGIDAVVFDGKAYRRDIAQGVSNIEEWMPELVCPSV